MPTVRVIIRTIFSRLLLIGIIICASPLILFMMILPEKYRYRNAFLYWGLNKVYWTIIKLACIPISYTGWEHLSEEPVVFAANHQSSLDIPLIGVLARSKPHLWLARHELLQSWFLRIVVSRLSVVVNVSSPGKATRSLIHLLRLLEQNNSDVMLFPEGSRYADGMIHSFYGGFVTVAKALNRPIIPVYIAGAHIVYPPKTFWIAYHPIRVVIGKPMRLHKDEKDDAFKERVQAWFQEQYLKERGSV